MSNIKHQNNVYRVINGQKLVNYCDLIYDDNENERVIAEAKLAYKTVRKIKNASSGYYHLFVSDTKPMVVEFINVGRGKVCKTISVKDTATLRKEIGKLLASKGWDLEDTETPNLYTVSAGYRSVGQVKVISA